MSTMPVTLFCPPLDPQDSAQDVASALSRKFPIHFGGGVVNRAQLVGLIAKLQGSLRHKDGPQTSIDKGNIIDKDNIVTDKDNIVIDKDKKVVGDDAIPNETTKQPPEQQHHGDDVVSDYVRVNLHPAIMATALERERQQQQRKEGSEDSAAEVKSSLGDPSEKREEIGDSLICTTGDDGDSLHSKAGPAAMAPQATSVGMVGECTTEHGLDYGNGI